VTDAFAERSPGRETTSRTDFTSLLVDSVRLLRGRPTLALPFLVAGLVAAVGDALRLLDPVPATPQTAVQRGLGHVVLHAAPSVTSAVGTRVAALLGLRAGPLVSVVLTEGVPLAVTAVAAVVVIVRVTPGQTARTGRPIPRRALLARAARLVGYELAVLAAFFVVATVAGSLGPLTLVVIVGLLFATVRLFVVPAAIARGSGIGAAVSTSVSSTRGHGWTLFGLVVVLGVAANLLVSLPVLLDSVVSVTGESSLPVGTALATTCVGTVHALLAGLAANRFA
jgi:hypothetical protein